MSALPMRRLENCCEYFLRPFTSLFYIVLKCTLFETTSLYKIKKESFYAFFLYELIDIRTDTSSAPRIIIKEPQQDLYLTTKTIIYLFAANFKFLRLLKDADYYLLISKQTQLLSLRILISV